MADREEIIEKQRQVLAGLEDFEPFGTFLYVDRDQDGVVSSNDLCNVLWESGVEASEMDWFAIVKYFDSTNKGTLKFEDYIQILLPWANDYLRSLAAERKPRNSASCQMLSDTVKNELFNLLYKEIEYHRDAETCKIELNKWQDYSPGEAFEMIDYTRQGYIDFISFEKFFKVNGFNATESDVNSIIRRMDVTADARISFNEFVEATTPINATKVLSTVMPSRSVFTHPLRNEHLALPEEINKERIYDVQKKINSPKNYQRAQIDNFISMKASIDRASPTRYDPLMRGYKSRQIMANPVNSFANQSRKDEEIYKTRDLPIGESLPETISNFSRELSGKSSYVPSWDNNYRHITAKREYAYPEPYQTAEFPSFDRPSPAHDPMSKRDYALNSSPSFRTLDINEPLFQRQPPRLEDDRHPVINYSKYRGLDNLNKQPIEPFKSKNFEISNPRQPRQIIPESEGSYEKFIHEVPKLAAPAQNNYSDVRRSMQADPFRSNFDNHERYIKPSHHNLNTINRHPEESFSKRQNPNRLVSFDNKAIPINNPPQEKYATREYPVYPGGYSNMNPDLDLNDPIPRYEEYKQDQNPRLMTIEHQNYPQNDLQEQRAHRSYQNYHDNEIQRYQREIVPQKHPNRGDAISPNARPYKVNLANPNETPEKVKYNQINYDSRFMQRDSNNAKRAKSEFRGNREQRNYVENKPQPSFHPKNLTKQYELPNARADIKVKPYTAYENNRSYEKIQGHYREDPRDRYRNLNSNQFRNDSPKRYVSYPVISDPRTDLPKQSHNLDNANNAKSSHRNEERKTDQVILPANPNESTPKQEANSTPRRDQVKVEMPKGAFNMLISPEIVSNTSNGWSFVPSPEIKKSSSKTGKPKSKKQSDKDLKSKTPIRM